MRRSVLVLSVLVILAMLLALGCTKSEPKPAENTDATAQSQTPEETTPPEAATTDGLSTGSAPSEPGSPTVFSTPDGLFSIEIPAGWTQTASSTEVQITDATSNVVVKWAAGATEPTFANAKEVEVKELEANNPGFKLVNVEQTTIAAGSAILISYEIESQTPSETGTVAKTIVMIYELFKDGSRVDITCQGPAGGGYEEKWKILADSFKWLK